MVAAHQRSVCKKYDYLYYACKGHSPLTCGRVTKCPSRRVRADRLDAVVWQSLSQLLRTPTVIPQLHSTWAHAKQQNLTTLTVQQEQVLQRKQRVERQVQRLLDAYQAEIITLSELQLRRQKLNTELHHLDHELHQLTRTHQRTIHWQQVIDNTERFRQLLGANLDRFAFEDRQTVAQCLIKKVVVTGEQVDIYYVLPFDSTPQVYNRSSQQPEGTPGQFYRLRLADLVQPAGRIHLRTLARLSEGLRRQIGQQPPLQGLGACGWGRFPDAHHRAGHRRTPIRAVVGHPRGAHADRRDTHLQPPLAHHRRLKPYHEVRQTLIYLRHNVAHAVVGELFGVSADTSENTFPAVVFVLRAVCPAQHWDAEKQWKKGEPNWTPDTVERTLIDSFAAPVRCPSRQDLQKRVYSGKKKRHTLKSQIVTETKGEILDLDPGHRGPTADKRRYEQSTVAEHYPPAAKQGDAASQGIAGVRVPHKKPKGGRLTEEHRAENRRLAAVRVHVEHGIRHIKGRRIVRDDDRRALGLFPLMVSTVVGLVQLTRLIG